MADIPARDSETGGKSAAAPGFGAVLEVSARAIIADAGAALSAPDLSDAERVHEVRKALKRWRAWLRLLSKPLGPSADQMRIAARDLMRALTGARDAQSALDALDDLRASAAAATPPLSPTSLASIEKRLAGMRDVAEQSGFTPNLRTQLVQYLEEATRTIDNWPLASIAFGKVADGLVLTYARARALMPDDWTTQDPEALHDLRRRVVEHRHQMDLIEPLWPRIGAVWGEETQRLRNRLGACQDLAMLANFTGVRQPLAPWRSKLASVIEARRLAHLKTAERLAGRLFAEKPKAFRRRAAALWKAEAGRIANSE
jgi:CHAD domain-containing protein